MKHEKKSPKVEGGFHLGRCRLCGKGTKAADPFWLARCPDC
jgi:hypothetical protein